MRKFAVFSATLFICILLAGLYGIAHDQVTYTISPEYFTKFKYDQFGFEPDWFGGDRQTVAVIGFFATWWTGIPIGFIIGLIAILRFGKPDRNKNIRKAIFIVFAIAFITGFVGYVYGSLTGAYQPKSFFRGWYFPQDLVDYGSYIKVGSIHNFSYLGGLLGLIAASIYLLRRKRTTVVRPDFQFEQSAR